MEPRPNTWFLVHTQVHTPNGISIGLALLCRAHDRNRPRDRARYSVRCTACDAAW